MTETTAITVIEREEGPAFSLQKHEGNQRVNPAQAYLATLQSTTSRKSMASKLNVFAAWAGYTSLVDCAWGAMRPEHILAFMTGLEANGRKASTTNCYLAALKGVAKTAWLAEAMTHENYLRINAIKGRKYYRLPSGRSITPEESRALLESCDTTDIHGCRDRLMIALMLGCGLRRAEVTEIRWEDFSPENQSFTLIGKGNKERRVFLPDAVLPLLNTWINTYRGTEPGRLFGRLYKNGRLDLTHPIDPSTVGRITAKRMQDACQISASAHDLRRTFATRLLNKNVDIVTVKNMMGHANIATTSMYDRRDEKPMQDAAKDFEM